MSVPVRTDPGNVLFDEIERARTQRRTGLLELEVRDQVRSLAFVGGELHLPATQPYAESWREVLARPRDPATTKEIGLLVDQLADALRNWGAVRTSRFHDGHARLPTDLVGPLPTGKLLRVSAARDPHAVSSVVARFGTRRLVADSPGSSGSYAWTPEELWVLERLRQPATLAELSQGSPIPREAISRAVAGLSATGQVRLEGGAARSADADEVTALAAKLAERLGADLDRSAPSAEEREDFRRRIAALLSNTGGLDHYELLGVDPDCEEAETQSAFEELARLVHPANAKRFGAPELDDALRFLFERATEAYRTLSDPARRVAYRNTLQLPEAAPAAIDPELRAREVRELARRQFDRAVAEERNGDYHTALTIYEEVSRLDPTLEHWSALAKLQQKNPSWTQRAIDSWRAALAIDPQNGTVRFALGELYERAGDADQALLCYQGAAGGPAPVAAAAAAAERLRTGRTRSDSVKSSGPRRLSSLFRRST